MAPLSDMIIPVRAGSLCMDANRLAILCALKDGVFSF